MNTELEKLAREAVAASIALQNISLSNTPTDVNEKVAADLAYRRALKRKVAADIAYEDALDAELIKKIDAGFQL